MKFLQSVIIVRETVMRSRLVSVQTVLIDKSFPFRALIILMGQKPFEKNPQPWKSCLFLEALPFLKLTFPLQIAPDENQKQAGKDVNHDRHPAALNAELLIIEEA